MSNIICPICKQTVWIDKRNDKIRYCLRNGPGDYVHIFESEIEKMEL